MDHCSKVWAKAEKSLGWSYKDVEEKVERERKSQLAHIAQAQEEGGLLVATNIGPGVVAKKVSC